MLLSPALHDLTDGQRPDRPHVAKAPVMAEVACIVVDGGGTVAILAPGRLERHPVTGEIFRLGEGTVTRIA